MSDRKPRFAELLTDETLWFLTGIDNDQWDDSSFTDACYQGSRLGTDLTKPPRQVAPIQARQGHPFRRRSCRGAPDLPAVRGSESL